MPDRIVKCTKPDGVHPDDWKDCSRCHVAGCGYSRLFEPNPFYEEQKGCCRWEHCIENRPIEEPRTPLSCPVFGHDCPGGYDQVLSCAEYTGEIMGYIKERKGEENDRGI